MLFVFPSDANKENKVFRMIIYEYMNNEFSQLSFNFI